MLDKSTFLCILLSSKIDKMIIYVYYQTIFLHKKIPELKNILHATDFFAWKSLLATTASFFLAQVLIING